MDEGTRLGAYRVLRKIGSGGMGSVWLAEHVTLGRRAALKVLHPEYSIRTDVVKRFFNEARAATAIADPGIVQVFEVGEDDDGTAFIVMELLDGEPLDRRLERERALPLADGLRLIRQVASTLGAAHARGIVHRDVKPENIYIVRDPEVPGGERAKVLDFGIAKLLDLPSSVDTDASQLIGTPKFMSPEQCRGGGGIDQRSDVYSLGCVLFALLTGRPPFVSEGIGEILIMHARDPAPAPSTLNPGIPAEIDQLVLRCLAKAPGQRFANGVELATAIDALLASSPVLPPGRPADASLTSAPTTLTSATGVESTSLAKRARKGVVAVLAAGAAAVAIALAAASDGEQAAPAPAAPGAPEPAPSAAPSPPPAVAPPPPGPDARVVAAVKETLVRFVEWSRDHAGEPCPGAAALGAPRDPWGHALAITCTEQPGDQIVGAVSAGPDGELGTVDDIASWQLGREVTGLVRGARWSVAPPPVAKPTAPSKPRRPARPAPTVKLDENGLPTAR